MKTRLARLLLILQPIAAVLVLMLGSNVAVAQQAVEPAPPGTIRHEIQPGLATGDHPGEPEAGVLPSPEQGIVPSIVSLLVFGIVFAVVATVAWPKIAKGLDERATKIREEIAAAESARKQAKQALEQYERSLADARAEAQKMLEKTKAEQQALAAELKTKAEAELGAMKDRARRDIDSAKRAALDEIYTHTANLATSVAAKILQREVTPRDQQRLVEESLAQLQPSRG